MYYTFTSSFDFPFRSAHRDHTSPDYNRPPERFEIAYALPRSFLAVPQV